MRPTALEGIRGIQEALLGTILPELQTMLAQDAAGTIQMLLESIANEWDTAVETLHADNRQVSRLLEQALGAIRSVAGAENRLDGIAGEIEGVLGEPADGSLAVSRLTARNERLRAILERVLAGLEDVAEAPEFAPLLSVKRDIYRHLRQVAARGWCFWDVLSFREKMARLRAEPI
ncbi:MAG TPA: hypothetical protein VFT91_04430 [Dehalococcoidia bacterium]|nr:hypothetical protein [Dehalococcoidia bacterium]